MLTSINFISKTNYESIYSEEKAVGVFEKFEVVKVTFLLKKKNSFIKIRYPVLFLKEP
jgi:hypothetical protein